MATISYLTTTHFDFGAVAQTAACCQSLGMSRPLICTDKGIVAAGILDKVRDTLGNDITATVYDNTPPNPTEEAVEEALALYKESGCDGIICIGGGSSIDLGKGVAILASHGGELNDYLPGATPIGQIAPLIAIPTTAGTGSEVSIGTVIISKSGPKLIFASPNIVPKFAICDPDLTMGLPPLLTAATGMDAMTHCIEAVLSPVVNPPAEGIGLDGLERAWNWIEKVVKDGSDREARWNMMMASTEGALAFVKGLGSVHAMSHALGRDKELKLHHGTLNAVILPAILDFNRDHVGDKYDRLRRAMQLPAHADLADEIRRLNERIGLPANLKEMGATSDMIPNLAQYSIADLSHYTNPIQPTEEEYEAMFASLIDV